MDHVLILELLHNTDFAVEELFVFILVVLQVMTLVGPGRRWLGDVVRSEATGKFSLARVQLLMFTVVGVDLYAMMCVDAGTLVDVPPSALAVIGMSMACYAVSKALDLQRSASQDDADEAS